jgi:hypothetical protein
VEYLASGVLRLSREAEKVVHLEEQLRDHHDPTTRYDLADDFLRDRANDSARLGEIAGPSTDERPEHIDVQQEPAGPIGDQAPRDGGFSTAGQAIDDDRKPRTTHDRVLW